MADILDKRPVNAEMTIFKTEVEPNKLNACIDDILMRLNRLETKSADVQPVKRGRWIIVDDVEHFIAICSECGRTEDSRGIKDMPYCHCGAKMDGEQNDT